MAGSAMAVIEPALQRRASFKTREGRCSTLNYCMFS
jgi:hypothetical protein